MVEMIHCKIQTRQAEIPNNFTGRLQPFGHQLILLFGKGTQHIVNLSATRKVIAYAETQARILLRAQRSGNVLPFPFRRKVPKARDRSSTTTSRFSRGMFSFCNQ